MRKDAKGNMKDIYEVPVSIFRKFIDFRTSVYIEFPMDNIHITF